MKKVLFISTLTLLGIISATAQDDMYFSSSKKSKATKASRAATNTDRPYVHDAIVEDVESNSQLSTSPYSEEQTYYSGSLRSVDEYNRRDRFRRANSDTLRAAADSITISMEDYQCYQRMKKYDGYRSNNVTVVIDADPWYYDSWYWHDPWYHPWHYSWYDPFWDPWYRPGGWYLGYSWGWGGYYVGGNWGWHSPGWYGSGWGWHRPMHYIGSTIRPVQNRTTGRWTTAERASRGPAGYNSRRGVSASHGSTNNPSRNGRVNSGTGTLRSERNIFSDSPSSTATTRSANTTTTRSTNTTTSRAQQGVTRSNDFGGAARNSGGFSGGGATRSGGFSGGGAARSGGFSGGARGGGGFSGGGARGGRR